MLVNFDFEYVEKILNDDILSTEEKSVLNNYLLTGENEAGAAYIMGIIDGNKNAYEMGYQKTYDKGYAAGTEKGLMAREERLERERKQREEWAAEERRRQEDADSKRWAERSEQMMHQQRQEYERSRGNDQWYMY